MNTTTQVGRVVADATVSYPAPSGFKAIYFKLAVTTRVRQADGTYNDKGTIFHSCTKIVPASNTLGQYIKKGKLLSVQGTIQEPTKYFDQNQIERLQSNLLIDTLVFYPGTDSKENQEIPF